MLESKVLQEVLESLGGIKGVSDAVDVVKKLKDLFAKRQGTDNASPEQQKTLELLGKISTEAVFAKLDAAAARADLLNMKAELEALKRFQANREDYAIVELRAGSFAYARKSAVHGAAPAPHVCAHCFEQSQRVVTLQLKKQDFGVDTLHCPACGLEVFKPNNIRMEVLSAAPRRNFDGW